MIRSLEIGEEIHAKMREQGLSKNSIVVGNAVIDMYAKCGALQRACEVFDELPQRDVVSWTALIAGYANHGLGCQAVKIFKQMEDERISPNAWTYVCILNACAAIGSLDIGETIHDKLREQWLLKDNIVLGNALIDMYTKCGVLQMAQKVFDELPIRDHVVWTILIAGYAENGHGIQALTFFELMQMEGIYADAVTIICALKICQTMSATEKGVELHADIDKKGLWKCNFVGNTLLNMYAKFASLAELRTLFTKLPAKDLVSWNILIAGCTKHEDRKEALACFKCMQNAGLTPDTVTYVSILKVCGIIGAVENGHSFHAKFIEKCVLERDVVLSIV